MPAFLSFGTTEHVNLFAQNDLSGNHDYALVYLHWIKLIL